MTRQEILDLNDLPPAQAVEVPQWGKTVYVRTLMGFERDEFDAAIAKDNANGAERMQNFRAKLVCACLCDEAGKRLFTYDDAPALGRKHAGAIRILFEAAEQANGMTVASVEAAAKN